MSMQGKMLTGELYLPHDPQLAARQQATLELLYD